MLKRFVLICGNNVFTLKSNTILVGDVIMLQEMRDDHIIEKKNDPNNYLSNISNIKMNAELKKNCKNGKKESRKRN